MAENREMLGSRLGFLLISAGCAIGLGNVWRFPFITGAYGGACFLLIFIVCQLMVMPVMLCEFAVGRASRRNMGFALKVLEPKGTYWHKFGWIALAGSYLLLMFYTTITGWMLIYCVYMVKGTFVGMAPAAVGQFFGAMTQNTGLQITGMTITVAIGALVCFLGLQNGVERFVKFLMIGLFAILLILVVHSFTLPGVGEGLSFYLKPDLSKVQKYGFLPICSAALNQAFFTLSVGMGSMAIFGSYVGKERSLLGESVNVIVLDTFVAIVAGLIMFPACYTYGLEVNAGPSLLFDTMASVFNHMAGGRWWGSLFFLFMVFAALSTVLAVCENILAMVREMTGWKRPLGCLVCGAGVFILAITTALGYSVFHFQPFAEGTAWLDLWDFLVSNNILPLGSLVFALYCCNKFGWGWDNFAAEANAGKGLKVKAWMKPIFRYLVPVAIIFIYIYGMVTFGWK